MDQGFSAPCPLYKKCGGCQLQQFPYPEQLRRKMAREISLLGKFGHVEPILGMDNPTHYRNKVCAAFGLDQKKRIVSGVYQPGSHRIVPVDDCLIEDETADRIIVDIRHMLRDFKMQVFDERSGRGFLRHVLVRRGFQSGEVMVVLIAASPIFPTQKPFVKKLLELHPEITTIILNVNDRFTPVVLGEREKVLYGPGTIEDTLCGHRFRISPRSFYQVNPAQTEVLYGKAVEFAALTGTETVLDAYCGVGTIGITANCWFTAGDAGEYMKGMAREGFKPDVVFMDPPRAGSSEAFLRALLKTAPARVVYVSCDPETLARDLDVLTAGGYRVQRIQPVDMFPFTEHVETVVLMSRVDR